MKLSIPFQIQALMRQIMLQPSHVRLLPEIKHQVEAQLGYQLLPAVEMLQQKNIPQYQMRVEELVHMTLQQKDCSIHISSIFLKLHHHGILNSHISFLLQQYNCAKYAEVILDFLTIIERHQPQLISIDLFEQLCQFAAFLEDETIRNSLFETYYRLAKHNPLSVAKIKQLFHICQSAISPSAETKQALLALCHPENRKSSELTAITPDIKSTLYDLSFVEASVEAREENIVKRWERENLFSTAIRRPGKPSFVTYDGPPFATGLPHYGHVLAMSIKGAISAHKALAGFDVETRFGWDCHGVPIEMIVQKNLGLDSHQTIMNMGMTNFNNACRQQIFKCVDAWESHTKRLGRFIDMGLGNDYRTMDVGYMSSVWGVFGQLFNKDLIYKGFKVVPYSPSLGTVLSDFEAGLDYQKIMSPSITMTFPLEGQENTQFLVWTTTPWSVPANVAIAVNPDYAYVKVHVNQQSYIMLKSRYMQYFKDPDSLVVEDIDIRDYLNHKYKPVFDSLPDSVSASERDRCYSVVESSHVTDTDGTGCVHICPAYGVDDHAVGRRYGLPVVDFIDENGLFKEVMTRSGESLDVTGLYFKYYKMSDSKVSGPSSGSASHDKEAADTVLIKKIKAQQRLFKQELIHHEYPLCWRTHLPLMYRAVDSWFVNVTSFKEKLIENNAQVNWFPETIGSNRFANWLASSHDWAISRTRYWGCPIPVWVADDDPNDFIVIDSKEKLEALTGSAFDDLHRENIDDVEIYKNGKRYQRIPEVLDCWFESGSMPYAQYGLAFNGDETQYLETKFPADFIAEGLDQTRGWFYALSVIGTALFDKIPFKNVIVNGILLGNDGKKMSKSECNYPPIDQTFKQYGADAMRLSLLGSPAVRANSVAVKDELFRETTQNSIMPLLNIYKFFVNSSNTHQVEIEEPVNIQELLVNNTFGPLNPFDAWLVYRVELFKKMMHQHLDAYDLVRGGQQIKDYIADLTTWYVRMSRTRVNHDNPVVLHLLHYALDVFSHHAAPYMPFVAESIHIGLYPNAASIHLSTYPEPVDVTHLEPDYQTVEQIRKIYTMSLALREEHRLRLRQPIEGICLDASLASTLRPHEDILKKLINCKTIYWINPNNNTLFDKTIQLGSDLGARLKKRFKAVKEAFIQGRYRIEPDGETLLFEHGETLSLNENEFFYVVKPQNPDFSCKCKGQTWVAINTKLTPELIQEGIVRDVMRELVKLRISLAYKPEDVMALYLSHEHKPLLTAFESILAGKSYRLYWVDALSLEKDSGSSMHTLSVGERGTTLVTLVCRKLDGMADGLTDEHQEEDNFEADSGGDHLVRMAYVQSKFNPRLFKDKPSSLDPIRSAEELVVKDLRDDSGNFSLPSEQIGLHSGEDHISANTIG